MEDPGTAETIWRLAVAAFVMVTPTLLFLGLLRGLERIRDDAFIEQWLREQGNDLGDDVSTVLANGIGIEADGSSGVRCPGCGESNASNARYCRNCLGRLRS